MLHVLRVATAIRDGKKPYCERLYFEGAQPLSLGGYMCFDPEFIRLGLRVNVVSAYGPFPIYGPVGNEWMCEDAFANLLGLNEVEAKFLFGGPEHIVTIDDRLVYNEVVSSSDLCVRRVERAISGEYKDCASWHEFRYG